MKTIFGIDYGSKLTGNTVIAILKDTEVIFMDVEKKIDADKFILNAAEHFQPEFIFLDAPLSLPGIYRFPDSYEDFHFRQADRECGAMSPMFLGGLVARAMDLKKKLNEMDITVYETYPKVMAQRMGLKEKGYKQNKLALHECRAELVRRFNENLKVSCKDIKTWHHLDALLALMSAMAYRCDDCQHFGDESEGMIIV